MAAHDSDDLEERIKNFTLAPNVGLPFVETDRFGIDDRGRRDTGDASTDRLVELRTPAQFRNTSATRHRPESDEYSVPRKSEGIKNVTFRGKDRKGCRNLLSEESEDEHHASDGSCGGAHKTPPVAPPLAPPVAPAAKPRHYSDGEPHGPRQSGGSCGGSKSRHCDRPFGRHEDFQEEQTSSDDSHGGS
jgi:hypothetical protein